MLWRFLRDLLSVKNISSNHLHDNAKIKLFDDCEQLKLRGKAREALKLLQIYQTKNPVDVDVLNNIACICDELGDRDETVKSISLAYQLDDRNLAVALNYIKYRYEYRKVDEALSAMRNLLLDGVPSKSYIVHYAAVNFRLGDAVPACKASLESWLSHFDQLRHANNFLLYSTYAESDERKLAAEHVFWAETLAAKTPQISIGVDTEFLVPKKSNKIRVGYLSPDYRGHSVRYFFRPVIDNHDKSKFETICYHDTYYWDEHTDAIRDSSDYFFKVNELTDDGLFSLMLSHDLDILVELSGHTSANRMSLFRRRVANVQMTGFGYPPTTGLQSIDYKVLDHFVAPSQAAQSLYAEDLLRLDGTFWCFDPKTEVNVCPVPPVTQNGYLTFGCFGNIAKITDQVLCAWAQILNAVPKSVLILRSIFFEDTAAITRMTRRLEDYGLTVSQFKLLEPLGPIDLFESYNTIDIVLDTFPFSGGTTTCFSTYMGVPVLTLVGKSLVSRMGGSVMTALGMSEWVCSSIDEYVAKAIRYATDIEALKIFRCEAQTRYIQSTLGNGKLFVDTLESAYLKVLGQQNTKSFTELPHLGELEILRRARRVMALGNLDAGMRIVDYCRKIYPSSGLALAMSTWRYVAEKKYVEGRESLCAHLEKFGVVGQIDALVQALRLGVYSGSMLQKDELLAHLNSNISIPENFKQQFYIRLLQHADSVKDALVASTVKKHFDRVLVLVVGTENDGHRLGLDSTLGAENIIYKYTTFNDRITLYRSVSDIESFDLVILARADSVVYNPDFGRIVLEMLLEYHVVGFSGARKWNRFDWINSSVDLKEAAIWLPCNERDGYHELNLYTNSFNAFEGNMVVLDGGFLAMRPKVFTEFKSIEWPYDNAGRNFLYEQFATNALAGAGHRLAVHKNLGVCFNGEISVTIDVNDDADMHRHVATELGFDELFPENDYSCIAFPFQNILDGVQMLKETLIPYEK